MLLGRDQERSELDRLLADARVGQSRVLALVGDAGIGKTALLDYAAGQADRMLVLRARGVESEAEVPFGGLLELLRPALGALDRVPAPQATALAGALAIGPGGASDRFATGAATLSLLAAYAEEAPVTLLVDDAHWLDGASAEALLFAIRRLLVDPIAVILTVREGEPSLLDGADLPVLRLGGVDRDTATALLARAAHRPLAPDLADVLYDATAGNPLALLEIADDAPRIDATAGHRIVPVSERIAQAFLSRAAAFDERTRRMLVLVAASDSADLTLLARAAQPLGLRVEDLAAAESGGLVRIEAGAVEFRHPLARSAVYTQAEAAERREAHRALAGALPDHDADRRAWHLASAALGPDDAASAALAQAAARARERHAYGVAAAAFERAARLAPVREDRCRLLFAAADAAWLAGFPERAVPLLDEVRDDAPEPELSVRVERLRGIIALRRGPVARGHEILVAAAELAAATDQHDLAVEMLAEAVYACFYSCDTVAMQRAAARIVELAPHDASPRTAFLAAIAHGMSLVLSGSGESGALAIGDALAILERSPELQLDPSLIAWATHGPLWLREAERGRALIDQALRIAREQGAVGSLPYLLQLVARDHATSDRWSLSEAVYAEAISLARETGQRVDLAASLAGLAWLEAHQGKEDECRTHAQEALEVCAELGIAIFKIWATTALGDLELGLGRPDRALEQLAESDAALRSMGVADVDVFAGPELVEAHLRVGDLDAAAGAADEFCDLARAKGQPWGLARAARCRGLLADDDELDDRFGEALRLQADTVDVFEEARTRLAYGARLRRARRRVQARAELRAALDTFERLGAAPWAGQAQAELAASGETARRRDPTTIEDLTPQELQIALLLAGGKTTREAAATLFLSPKTIEYHLRHVYRKLGISSRAELAAATSARVGDGSAPSGTNPGGDG
jgi:DNA-binding CsgD family transcriptional regulator